MGAKGGWRWIDRLVVSSLALSLSLLDGLERVAPRVQIRRLPDVGHWTQNEAPREVNQMMVESLRGADGVW